MRPSLPYAHLTLPAVGGDEVRRFVFENEPVRGHFVRMQESWRSLREHREYPAPVRELLGEAASAAVLLAATLKFHGTLTLQLAGDGAVRMLIAQCTHDFRVRALVRLDEECLGDARGPDGEPARLEAGTFRCLVGESGRLVVTVEAAGSDSRYQGIVPLAGRSLSESLEEYFASSEQLPTRVRLATDERQAAGVLIQRLPDRTESREDARTETAWRDAQSGICAVGRGELLSQPLEQMLVRHFGQCDVRVFAGTTVRFECRCNRPRVARLLRSLGAEEVRDVLAERGCVTVTCDFCNRPYRFDAIDVEQLLAAGAAEQAPSSVQ